MRSTRRCVLLALLASAFSASARADEGSAAEPPQAARAEPAESRLTALIGLAVIDVDGTTVGELDELLVSPDGSLRAVLAIGGFAGIGEKLILVNWDELVLTSATEEGVTVPRLSLREARGRELAESRLEFRYESD